MDERKKIAVGALAIFGGILLSCALFYVYSDLQLNFFVSFLGTVLLLTLLFLSHRRLFLSCGIFTAVTVLMFADMMFHSYYDGYLTVELLGSAKFLGDVTDVIVLLLRPGFFTVFLGTAMVWAGAVFLRRAEKPCVGLPPRKRRICGAALAALLAISVINPLQIPYIQSVSSTEIISYHIKDIVKNTTGYGKIHYDAQMSMEYAADEDDPLFGVAQGRNLIVIQAEALQNFVVGQTYNGQVITPVLNSLVEKDTLYFDNYYMQIAAGNTSDAEFATNNSIYGSNQSYTYELYKDNAYRGLPWLLMERGYSTVVMHGYERQFWSRDEAYETQGFETFIDASGFTPKGTTTRWGINDSDFLTQSVSYLKEQEEPFYGFLITLSCHTPFELPRKLSDFKLKKEHEGTLFGNYLRSVHYADAALGDLISQLKKEGLYDDSVIAIYGDHFGLSVSDPDNVKYMSEFLGRQYRFSDAANIPLLIHIPKAKEPVGATVSVAGGQMDFLPTMAYLLGFEELDTLYMGRNLLAEDQQGFVVQKRYAKQGSFITDDYCYMASADELFENGKAYRLKSDEELELTEEMRRLFELSYGTSELAQEYLDSDALRELYYADGRPDRVKTRMVPVKKKPSQEEQPPAVTPGAITDGEGDGSGEGDGGQGDTGNPPEVTPTAITGGESAV